VDGEHGNREIECHRESNRERESDDKEQGDIVKEV
jgi:hypothetical protein